MRPGHCRWKPLPVSLRPVKRRDPRRSEVAISATGVVGADRNFKMTATEVGGAGRTATITGQVRSDGWLVANIIGPNVDCKNITVPIYRPSSGGGG